MPQRFRKKPVVIEAVQFTGTNHSADEVMQFVAAGEVQCSGSTEPGNEHVLIPTLEGEMRASVGDWIIKGVQGEFYPCKPDIFAATYEPEEG